LSLGNTVLWLGGFLVEGVVFYLVISSVRRVVRLARRKRQPIRMTATVQPELPTPPRKEISR
jgi:hypothetical protein